MRNRAIGSIKTDFKKCRKVYFINYSKTFMIEIYGFFKLKIKDDEKKHNVKQRDI